MPTHLIYAAYRNTEKILYDTKDAEGKEFTRHVVFVDPLTHPKMEMADGQCIVCGQALVQGLPAKHAFSDVFTDWNVMKNIGGTHVCPACSFCLLTSAERLGVRTFSHAAADKLELLNRPQLRNRILNPPDPPFVINVAVSQKKHIAFKGYVNYSRDIFHVQYEEMPILVNREEFRVVLDLFEHYMSGFTKTEIFTGEFNHARVLKFGYERWEAFEEKIKHYRGTPVLEIVNFVSQKIEEEERVTWYLDSVLKMPTPQPQPYSSMPSTGAATNEEAPAGSTCGGRSNGSPAPAPNEPEQLELF